jgi:tetratricopeptide (TPR) repeat protein
VLVAVGLLVYANSLTGPFIFDDAHGITENPSIRHLWPVWDTLVAPPGSGMAGRPVVNLTFAINYALGGWNVWGYHTVNLAIHILTGLVLLGVMRRSVKSDGLAFVAALIWLVHPVLTESVVYISQRTEMLMGLFLLLTFYCFLRSLDSPHSQRWQIAAIVACGFGMGSKEVMAVAPVLVLAYDYVFVTGSWKESLRQRRLLYVGLAATLVMLPLLVGGVSVAAKMGRQQELTSWGYAKIQCTVLVHYLRLCFWPRPLLIDYAAWPRVNSVTQIIPQGVLILGLVAVSLWGTWRRQWWGFLGLWFFVILAPTSSFLPLATEVGAERRLYLPSIAVVLLVVVSAAELLRQRQSIALGLSLAVVAVFGAMTWQRNGDYATAYAIWSDTVAKAPGSARAHNNLANALQTLGRSAEAEQHYRLALAGNPLEWKAWNNLAGLLAKADKLDEAVMCYRRAQTINPRDTDTLLNMGVALGKLGKFPEALQCFENVARLDPQSVKARYNLGFTLAKMQRYADAVPHFHEALELQPNSATILYGLGNALTRCGQTNNARRYLTEAARIDPKSAPIRQALEALGQ